MARVRGTGKRDRLEREAREARAQAAHGTRTDIVASRGSKKSERVGGKASLGNGLSVDAMRERDLADARHERDGNRNIRLQDAAMRPRGEYYRTTIEGNEL